jgi:hypothetical protein
MDTVDHVDHQRWLIDNGFINDLHKDNLYMYGALVHKEIDAIELKIDLNKKTVEYDLYMRASLQKKVDKFNRLSKSQGILDLWLLKRLIKKEGNLNFLSVLSNFVKDYLGPKWAVVANLKDISDYEEGFEQKSTGDVPVDQSANKE